VDCDEYREAARAFAEVMIQRNSIEAAPERQRRRAASYRPDVSGETPPAFKD
jgi:hypothetical protein